MNKGTDTERKGPLEGVVVVGLEQSVAAPLCTRILADMGARVIKVERHPSGDFARHWDDHVNGESAQFWWLNGGKESIAMDLRDSADRERFMQLLERADVLVQNMSPAAADRLGIGAGLEAALPHLVNCQISGYGAKTPLRDRKAYDMLIQAESGIMSLTGTAETPTRVGVSICDVATGLYAAILVLGALRRQEQTDSGGHLDVAMFDVGLEFIGPMLTSFVNAGVEYERLAQHHHGIAPYGVFACSDGAVMLAVEQDAEWKSFATEVIGAPELADDPRFASNLDRVGSRDELARLIGDAFAVQTCAEVRDKLAHGGFAYAFVNDVAGVAGHPVTAAREALAETETADGQPARTPVGLGRRLFADSSPARRPPAVDQDRQAILDLLADDPGRT